MKCVENLVGMKFGKLYVVEKAKSRKQPSGQIKSMWKCKCECGKEILINTYSLKNKTRSCGCERKETLKRMKKHGMYGTRIYRIWANMKNRCNNKNVKAYKNYGARGISVCNEWKNNFENFYNWAINNGYNDKLTIDRIDNNGNYEPNNCRWVTSVEQGHNKRNSINLTYNNQTKHITDWAKEYNLTRDCLWERLYVLNWSIEKALLTTKH